MRDAAARHVREAVGERVGVEVAGPETPMLHDRADAQTLAKEDWPALESYVGGPALPAGSSWTLRVARVRMLFRNVPTMRYWNATAVADPITTGDGKLC